MERTHVYPVGFHANSRLQSQSTLQNPQCSQKSASDTASKHKGQHGTSKILKLFLLCTSLNTQHVVKIGHYSHYHMYLMWPDVRLSFWSLQNRIWHCKVLFVMDLYRPKSLSPQNFQRWHPVSNLFKIRSEVWPDIFTVNVWYQIPWRPLQKFLM